MKHIRLRSLVDHVAYHVQRDSRCTTDDWNNPHNVCRNMEWRSYDVSSRAATGKGQAS